MKIPNHYRWPKSWYDLYGDGRFPKERLKGKDKKEARKRAKRKNKEINNILEKQGDLYYD